MQIGSPVGRRLTELTGVEIEREREDVGKWGECLLILGFRAYRV